MKAKFVYENISFERGRDPKSVVGIGLEGYLEGNSLKDKVYPASNPRRAAAELASEFMYDIDLSEVYYLGRLDVKKITDSPDWALKRLLPYIIDENQSSRRETGAGTVIRVYDTPYGKVVFEGVYGMPRYGTAWAERETMENLFADRKINESIKFERGKSPKDALELGFREYIRKSINWGKRQDRIEEILDNPKEYISLELKKYKGYYILLREHFVRLRL